MIPTPKQKNNQNGSASNKWRNQTTPMNPHSSFYRLTKICFLRKNRNTYHNHIRHNSVIYPTGSSAIWQTGQIYRILLFYRDNPAKNELITKPINARYTIILHYGSGSGLFIRFKLFCGFLSRRAVWLCFATSERANRNNGIGTPLGKIPKMSCGVCYMRSKMRWKQELWR